MTDLTYGGTTYKALVHADRNGWFYALDRSNGKLIYAEPFVHTTSIGGMKDGVPQADPAMRPTIDKQVFTCPSFLGGKNWWPISVDPQTQMAYIPTQHACMDIKGAQPVAYKAGLAFLDETFEVKHDPTTNNWGSVQAVDLNTGKQVWQYETHLPWSGATLATSGGLMFSGSTDGHFMAFDAKTGKVLWTSAQLSSGIIGVPTTYLIDGKQYVAVWAGMGRRRPHLGWPDGQRSGGQGDSQGRPPVCFRLAIGAAGARGPHCVAAFILGAVVHRAEADATLTVCVDAGESDHGDGCARGARGRHESKDCGQIRHVPGLWQGRRGILAAPLLEDGRVGVRIDHGFPGRCQQSESAEDLRATSAYAATGFVLVSGRDRAARPRLANCPRAARWASRRSTPTRDCSSRTTPIS